MAIKAIYENGIFKPLEEVPLKEGTEVEVYARSGEKGNGKKPKSIRDFGFFGMWKDREDIGTGVEYVNRIRKYRREPDASQQ
jgi:predicted DNA-binding antitoxin AbrB/MazE fold protein